MKKSSGKPKVSIIIPTYNSGNTLSECLKGIFSQNYPFCEVIIVDNFSNDATVAIAKEFEVKIIQQKCSPALARNIGITNSTGKHIVFIDSDQVLSPTVIEECVRKCEDEDVGMVRIPEVFIGKGFWGSCSAAWKNCYFVVEKTYGNNKGIMTGEPRFFLKEHIVQVGMLDDSLVWGEDYDLYMRMRAMSVKESSCKSKLYHYEPASIKSILVKNLLYGKSMPTFVRQTQKQILSPMLKHALLTFRKVLKDFKKSPAIIAGCIILLYLKAYSMMIGLIVGFIGRFSK